MSERSSISRGHIYEETSINNSRSHAGREETTYKLGFTKKGKRGFRGREGQQTVLFFCGILSLGQLVSEGSQKVYGGRKEGGLRKLW